MTEKITEAYNKLNQQYIKEVDFPNNTYQKRIISDLNEELKGFIKSNIITSIDIQCDDANNPCSIIDENCIVARISWRNKEVNSPEYQYHDMIFGIPENRRIISHLVHGIYAK
jgi:hypothetical protein